MYYMYMYVFWTNQWLKRLVPLPCITCHRMLPSLLVVGAAVSLLDPSCHAGRISTAAGAIDARQHPWRALGTDQSHYFYHPLS